MDEFDQLKQLLSSGRLKLGISIRPMNSPGSPVYRYAENLWPPSLVLGASLAGTVAVHYYLGMAIIAVGLWWWLAKMQPKVSNRVYERTSALILNDVTAFDALWRKGILSLIFTAPDGAQQVATRRDDWRAFIRSLPGNA